MKQITRTASLIIPFHKDRTNPVPTNESRPTTLGTLQGHGHRAINKSKSWFRELTFLHTQIIRVMTYTMLAVKKALLVEWIWECVGWPVVHTGWAASMCEDMASRQSWKTGRRQSNGQLRESVCPSRKMSNKTRVQQEEWVWCVPETARKPATAKVRGVA